MKKQILFLLLAIASAQIAKSQCTNATYSSSSTNYISKFADNGGCITTSLIQESGGGVGINKAPSYTLDVAGIINNYGYSIYSSGHNNNNGGITNAGAISGATTISASGAITGGSYSGGTISGTTVTGSDDFNASTSTKGYKINGSYVLRHINGSSNILVGPSSGASITSGTNNSFFGNSSGYANTTGGSNTFQGYNSGAYNTTGSNNAIVGYEAGKGVSGTSIYSNNSFFGYQAGFSTLTGGSNICIGYKAGYSNTSADNVFLGANSGYSNTTGYSNVISGYNAGYNNATGSFNTISGFEAGKGTATYNYSNNSFFGYLSGYSSTTGSENTFSGGKSGYSNTTGTSNVISGYNAGYYNATGNSNSIYGYQAGYGVSTYSFSEVTFLGYKAGFSNKGNYNTFLGTYSGYSNAAAGYNTFIGYASGYANNSASNTYNTFIGHNSGRFNTSGDVNTCVGHQSGYNNSTGARNTFVGVNSGYNSTAGFNTAVGHSAGLTNSTGTYNTFMGYQADAGYGNLSNATAIGYGATVNNTNDFVLGNASVGALRCNVQTISTLSDSRIKKNIKENVPGLEFINLLKPVTYSVDVHIANSLMGHPIRQDSLGKTIVDTAYWDGKYDVEKALYTGFVAQQVDSAAQTIGYDFSGVIKPKNNKDLYALSYSTIVVPLVKAVQELSSTIDSLKAVPSAKKASQNNDSLIKRIEQLESLMNQCCTANSDGQNQNSERQGTIIKENQIELTSTAMLYQNSPNPFGDGTTIKYFVPENSQAQIIFYDEFGSMLKEFKVEEKGMGQLNISSINLASGSYSYSLIINGKVIDTKKMMKVK